LWIPGVGHYSDTHALAFDHSRGILIIQTPNPLTTETLAHGFRTTILRPIHNLQLAFCGVPVQDAQFHSRRERLGLSTKTRGSLISDQRTQKV